MLAGAVALLATHRTRSIPARRRPRRPSWRPSAGEGEREGAVQGEGGGKTVRALEDEFSIKLEGGNYAEPGKYRFQVVNEGKIEHDLAIEGDGVEEKTALIGRARKAALEADLKPAKYRFCCTVPGHAQSAWTST